MNVRPAPPPCCPACDAPYAALTPKCWLCSRPMPERLLYKRPAAAEMPATVPGPRKPATTNDFPPGGAGDAPGEEEGRAAPAAEDAARRDMDLTWPMVLLVALAVVVEAFRYKLDWGVVSLIVAAPALLFLLVGVDEGDQDEASLRNTLNRLVLGAGYFLAALALAILVAIAAIIALFLACWVSLVVLAR